MNRSSIFKRKIDFEKSHGSYFVDKDNQKEYLDFFGQYSTLAIGYNHPIFKTDDYLKEIQILSHQKITNCEVLSNESAEFDKIFQAFTSNGIFSYGRAKRRFTGFCFTKTWFSSPPMGSNGFR